MKHSIHELWAVPLGILLLLWAAFLVIGIKGLLFHREPRRRDPTPEELAEAALFEPDTGEADGPTGIGYGCAASLLLVFWPLWLASKIDEWLPPPKR